MIPSTVPACALQLSVEVFNKFSRPYLYGALQKRRPISSRKYVTSSSVVGRQSNHIEDDEGNHELKASRMALHELFSNEYRFLIPNYQRPYEWDTSDMDNLLTDLLEKLPENTDNPKLADSLELGNVTLRKHITRDGSSNVTDVVDGQQRLTSLSLILAKLKQKLESENEEQMGKEISRYLLQEKDFALGREPGPRIMVKKDLKKLYESLVMGSAFGEHHTMSEQEQRLLDNARWVEDYLKDMDTNYAVKFYVYLIQRCYFLVQQTSDIKMAFQIFRSQTGRGKDLQVSDILKAELLQAVSSVGGESKEQELTALWERTEKSLTRDGLQVFLVLVARLLLEKQMKTPNEFEVMDRFLRMLREKDRMQSSSSPDSKGGMLHFAYDVLPNAAAAYHALTKNAYTSAKDRDLCDPNVNLLLYFLNSIPAAYSQWKLVAFRVLYDAKRRREMSFALQDQLAALERMAVCFWFIGEPKHRREARFFNAMKELEKGGEHWQQELQLTEDECARFKAAIDSPELYKKGSIPKAKYLLLRVDALLRETPSSAMNIQTQAKKVTIEHILPQAPTDVWLTAFPNEADRQAMTNQLGNLTLISRTKNSASGQLPYCEKLERYFTNPGTGTTTSDYALNNDLARQHRTVWNPLECRSRHSRLMQLLCGESCWHLP